MIENLAKNAKEFSQQLSSLAVLFDTNMETIIRASILRLFTNIIRRSPVDTGAYRASHMIISGRMPEDNEGIVTDIENKGVPNVTGWKFDIENDEFVVIFNNVPYAERLEDGHSDQAPEGIYSVALEEFNSIFREELKQGGFE
ncbi:MAG: HK97 gp10 family phage protein [Bacteroidota bacterium]